MIDIHRPTENHEAGDEAVVINQHKYVEEAEEDDGECCDNH